MTPQNHLTNDKYDHGVKQVFFVLHELDIYVPNHFYYNVYQWTLVMLMVILCNMEHVHSGMVVL